LARFGLAGAPNFPLRDLGDFDTIKIGIILIHFPVEESIQIQSPGKIITMAETNRIADRINNVDYTNDR
jgi:hypothetical protein